MMFEWMSDPSAWIGLLTLVLLEIVLGIDNLVFIAILAEKLPPEQRNRARVIGLGLALVMRLILLASISWVMTLTKPLFEIVGHGFSGRDMILIFGGLFLLFKGTMELHERIEGKTDVKEETTIHPPFWVVIAQIVVLDAVFSLDSVITAVGMVPHLEVMMIAVIIAVGIMLLAAKPLMNFVNKHPTVVILCLGFLMMIGFSLIVEGLGFHIPKGYLYAAIGFSVAVEAINQATRRNREKMITTTDLRSRTASAVIRLLGGKSQDPQHEQLSDTADILASHASVNEVFSTEEKGMIHGVLTLAERPVRSIMTPRRDLEWLDLDDPDAVKSRLLDISHSRVLLAHGTLDNFAGVALTHTILNHYLDTGHLDLSHSLRQPLVVHENVKVLTLLEQLRHAPMQIAIVLNEYGSIEGIATPLDILEAIAGEFPDEHDHDELGVQDQPTDGSWLFEGSSDIRHVSLSVGHDLLDDEEDYSTLSGYLLLHFGRVPQAGEQITADGLSFTVLSMEGQKIDRVQMTHLGGSAGSSH